MSLVMISREVATDPAREASKAAGTTLALSALGSTMAYRQVWGGGTETRRQANWIRS